MLNENEKKQKEDIDSLILQDKKFEFIKNVVFIKQNNEIIEYETGFTYTQYMAALLGDLMNVLYNQLIAFDLCTKFNNQMAYFQLNDITSITEITKYTDESLKFNAFKEIEYNITNISKINQI